MQEAETDIIILTCCPGCKVNAKSSPHPLLRAANMESDATDRGRVKGERGRKERKGCEPRWKYRKEQVAAPSVSICE